MRPSSNGTVSTISTVEDDTVKDDLSSDQFPILPTSEEAGQVFASSKHIWQGYLKEAKLFKSIPQESLRLSKILHRFPALPDNLKGLTSFQGYSTWRRSSPGNCSLTFRTGSQQRRKSILSASRPTKCEFSNLVPFLHSYDETGSTQPPSEHKNGIFIVLAGWVYILAKNLLERQDLPLQYSTNPALVTDRDQKREGGEKCITVDIGDGDPDDIMVESSLGTRTGVEITCRSATNHRGPSGTKET